MKTLLLVLAALVGFACFIPLSRREDWWIRIFDFPRVQILTLGLLSLVALLYFIDLRGGIEWSIAGFLLGGLALQVYRVFPYTKLSPKEVKYSNPDTKERTITLFVANVLMTNRRSERLLDLIRNVDPDVIIALEPDTWWDKQLRVLEKSYPYACREPLDNRYGMILQSRLELIEPEIKYLVRPGVPSIHTRVRLRSGDMVWLHAIHPEPPSPTEATESTPRDAELLIVGKKIRNDQRPTIVAGDLNDVAWSYTTTLFQKVSGLLDPRKGRGMINTYNAKIPLLRFPLDHVFHSRDFLVHQIRRLASFGSDHFPVMVTLVYEPEARHQQKAPETNGKSEAVANEKIGKASYG